MTNERIKDRIAKLLALGGNNPNEAEAEVAMRKASELMMQHGISEAELSRVKQSIIEGTAFLNDDKWHRLVANAVTCLYGTRYVMYSDHIRFVGRSSNIEASEETFPFLIAQVEALYKTFLPRGMTKSARAEFRRTFKENCAMQVWRRASRIQQDQQSPSTTGTALVVHRETLKAEIDDYFGSQGIRSTKRSVQVRTNTAGAAAGRIAGESVRLHREVNA